MDDRPRPLHRDEALRELLEQIHHEYQMRYPLLGSGRNRATYRVSEFQVVKVPLGEVGMGDNLFEADQCQMAKQKPEGYFPLADCDVFFEEGIPLLSMEYVEPYRVPCPCPEDLRWTLFVDCQQVGHNHQGRLVVYDYGP